MQLQPHSGCSRALTRATHKFTLHLPPARTNSARSCLKAGAQLKLASISTRFPAVHVRAGTKFRQMLRNGDDIPEWFAFKSVVNVLREQIKAEEAAGQK